MRLWSDSWANGEAIPARFAAGRRSAGGIDFSDNVNPHLAWSEAPTGTRSFALIAHDFDVPSQGDDVNRHDREVPAELPRVDFFHWVMVDIAVSACEILEGEFSTGFRVGGKPGPTAGTPGMRAELSMVRHGLNDFTGWFAGDPDRAGRYFGYDGPFPPFNDSLIHHYAFTVYALAIDRVPVEGCFTGAQVRASIYEHILAEATLSGTYTLNKRLMAG